MVVEAAVWVGVGRGLHERTHEGEKDLVASSLACCPPFSASLPACFQ